RQIVIASDRPPQELGMEERLQSRFRLGLCVDVQPPDLETRIAILQLKAQRDELYVPDDVIEFIAHTFDQNIRELEGALVRVVAWGDLTGQPITSELAEQALEDLLPQAEAEIPPDLILEESARYFGLSVQDLISPNRSRPLTTARHVAMYLMRECSGQSLVKIGDTFGGRDHTTARHGILKVEKDRRAGGASRATWTALWGRWVGPGTPSRGPPAGAPIPPPGPHVLRGRYARETACYPCFPQPLLLLKEVRDESRSSEGVDK